ncbi:MAG: DUF4982 domain-containing protein, partial [Lutimonas sp.]
GPAAVNEYMNDPMKLGLISWTSHAYYTFHPTKNINDRSRGGFMTVFRYPRPGLMWYKAELTKYPFVHIETAWKKGTSEVVVYSNSDQVELLLNGRSIAKQVPSKKDEYKYLNHAPFIFSVVNYEPGTLTANALADGRIIASDKTSTPENPEKIILELDTKGRSFIADGSDILVAYAKVVDKNGTIITDAKIDVEFTVKGSAEIIGDKTNIKSNPFTTEYGVAPALIRSGTSPGEITVTAKAKGLKSGSATVTMQEANFNIIQANSSPIYDFESVKVDIGGEEQLVQFDWIPWTGKDKSGSTKSFEALGGFTASITSVGDETKTRWLGEINVMGKYGFANGEGVLSNTKEGMLLEFSDLKKGNYRLNTVHHAPRTNTDSMDPNQEKMTTYQIYQIPYSKLIQIEIEDANGSSNLSNVKVTEGKDMQTSDFGSAEILFESDGKSPVKIIFKDTIEGKGVWLNSFVLSQSF